MQLNQLIWRKQVAKKERVSRVKIMFEPNRMKDAYLIEAYEILMPSNKEHIYSARNYGFSVIKNTLSKEGYSNE